MSGKEFDQLLLNRIRTPDGTELTSWHRHDFVTYEDANGHTYMVDGGTAYIRRYLVADAPHTELSEYYEVGNQEHNRKHARWGTYGKSGTDPLKRVCIKDLETDHIEAIIANCHHMSDIYRTIMEAELEHRNAT